MTRRVAAVALTLVALTAGRPFAAPRMVEVASLADLARADARTATVYVSPRLAQLTEPLAARFIIAHELAHLRLGHRAPSAAAELAADRSAALTLDCATVDAARRWLASLGPMQADRFHPSGTTRALALPPCQEAR